MFFPKFSPAREGGDSLPHAACVHPLAGKGTQALPDSLSDPEHRVPNSSLHHSRDTDSWVPTRTAESGSNSPHPPPPPGPQRVICWTRTLCKAQAARAHRPLPWAGGSSGATMSPSHLRLQARPGGVEGRELCLTSEQPHQSRDGLHPLPSSGTFCSVGVAVATSPPCCRVTR